VRPANLDDLLFPDRLLQRLERAWDSARSDPTYERTVVKSHRGHWDGRDE
jgi:hypothetical protein